MTQEEHRDMEPWPSLPERPWRPPPYSLLDACLVLVGLALLLPLAAHLIQLAIIAIRGSM